MEVRAVADASPKCLVAPGNAGTAREPRVRNVDVAADDIAGLRRVREGEERRAHRRRPGRAAGRRRRRCVRGRGPALLRPAQAAAQLEGSKDSPRNSWRATASRPRPMPLSRARRSTRLGTTRSARRSSSRPTGSPPARAWSSSKHGGGSDRHGRMPCSPASSAPRAHQVVIEEFLRGRGSELHRHGRRPERAAARHLAGPQAAASTATRAPTPAAWAPIRPRRWSRRAMHERIMREVIEPDQCAAWRQTACRTPAFSTPAS